MFKSQTKMNSLWCLVILANFIREIACGGGNILFLNGIASPSHHLWNRVLIKGLAAKGYNITMVSVDNDENPSPNIHYIHMEEAYNTLYNSGEAIDLMEYSARPLITGILNYNDFCFLTCEGIMKSKGLEKILSYPDVFKFDSVIYDFTCGPCLLPLLHKFNYPPLVSVTAFNNPPYTLQLTGGQKFPSIVPHFFVNYSNLMSLPQRLINHLMYFLDY
jgi:glucuronosyltransferase